MADTALAYLRVSTVLQEENGKNLESQLAEIRKFCEKNGYELADEDVFRDIMSGVRTDRQGYYELLARIEKGNAQVIVAYEVSRFGRNGLDNAWLMVKAKEYGFRLETVTGGTDFLANPENELLFDILTAIAKYERSAILFRMKRGKTYGGQRGNWVSGKAPLGYTAAGPKGAKTLVPNARGVVVKEIFERFLRREPMEHIATWANGATGMRLDGSHVRRILLNPVYAGVLRFDGQEAAGKHPALVDSEVWERTQRRLKRFRNETAKFRNNSTSKVGTATVSK